MKMKLDDVDLIKRNDKDGKLSEIRSVRSLSIYGRRQIVELPIPGSVGNVFQDMGRKPITISLEGDLVGPNATKVLDDLNSKFELKKPIKFSTDITPISGITEIVMENFTVHFAKGERLGIRYSMILKEYTSANAGWNKGSGETPPPSQENDSQKELQKKVNKIFEESKAES
jgi:hypothetical protein